MGVDIKERLLEELYQLAKKYGIKKVVMFGSRARGDHRPTSDIDLAIYPPPCFASQGRFCAELDDLHTLLKMDIVFVDSCTDIQLLQNIKREGIVIYERSQK